MAQGLSPTRVVDVDTEFSPLAVAVANFDQLVIMGDSDVIDTGEVIREYNSIDEVTDDFDLASPEYLAAVLYFSQSPQPNTLFIARWARVATKGLMVGGVLSGAEQLLSLWTGITTGSFRVTIDGGSAQNITGLNFSAVTNLNQVATAINGVLTGAVASWTGSRFIIKSNSTGTSSVVTALTATGGGVDISARLKGTAATLGRTVTGIAAETAVACVSRIDGRGWYAATFAASVMPNDAALLAVMAYIQAASEPHMFGVTTQNAGTIDSSITSDIASQASLADYTRTVIQYSLSSPYAIVSEFGRAFSVDFSAPNSTITMKFKKQPGVTPEILSATQATTLDTKRCNVYALYTNGASILQEGVMAGEDFFDEIHTSDALANRLQTAIFNILYKSPKIAQTDAGVHVLLTGGEGVLSQFVQNGFIAPGTWTAVTPFKGLDEGDYMPKGWQSFVASVNTQSVAEREARDSPPLVYAIKLAGAVHKAHVLVNVNR